MAEGLPCAWRGSTASTFTTRIVAAALEADCATLYAEDLPPGQVIDGRLTIHNPFNA